MQDLFRFSRRRGASATSVALTFVGLAGLLAAAGCVGGCAGTSPQFNTPQMNTPSLNAGGVSAGNRSGGSAGGGKAAPVQSEATLPPLDKVETPKDLFVVEPYLQLGDQAVPAATESVVLRWTVADGASAPDTSAFVVETRASGTPTWQKAKTAPTLTKIAVPGVPTQRAFHTTLDSLAPGMFFDYRISRGDKPVFVGRARARKPVGQPLHFVVFGDTAEGNADQKRITYQASREKPDFIFITGDIVYDRGRASEYLDHFFPIFNANIASTTTGAPLLRSTLFVAAVGNHDTAYRELDKYPDGLAYYYFWDQPKNGPALTSGSPNTCVATGDENAKKALFDASGDAYPRMANFSFDYGATHWLVLDSNPYVDWSNEKLREWVEKDLSGSTATWKFVAFHHPPFHSSIKHKNDQFMRVLCDLFEKYKVDVVWSGHVHNYQRSYPLHFTATPGANGALRDTEGRVSGKWTLDKAYDGVKTTKASAPIYIVTGGGGAGLYDPKIENDKSAWQEFTTRYIASVHSMTVVDADGAKLTVRQVSDTGKELDKFVLTK